MRYKIRLKIGNRLSATSSLSLREFCIAIVDRYSLTEKECETIVTMQVGQEFKNNDLVITRVK